MKAYLQQHADPENRDFVAVIDNLPLWSAPFGLSLLETVELKKGLTVLDLGCGFGFPLIELAERLGASCRVYGLDLWKRALERARLKQHVYQLRHVQLVEGIAEQMPFDNTVFDLIVSNNGINNVVDMRQTLQECARVAKPHAQLTVTVNLEETMREFYAVLQATLAEQGLSEVIPRMRAHIAAKRKPLDEIKMLLETAGFAVRHIQHDSFQLRFVDGATLLNHSLIKYWFLDAWKHLLNPEDVEPVFDLVESKLNFQASQHGTITLTIPFVTIDCRRR